MANAILPNITRQHVGMALRQMRHDCHSNSRELTAINKAALNLEACVWTWTGDALVIESATQTGLVRYHIQHDACDCQAATHGRACWHRAAYRLLLRAATLAQQPTPQRPRYTAAAAARITAAANAALFA